MVKILHKLIIAMLACGIVALAKEVGASSQTVSRDELPEYRATVPGVVEIEIEKTDFLPNLDGVKVQNDVEYIDRDGEKLHLILLSPEAGAQDAPCIVYVQGSAWHKQHFAPQNLGEYVRLGYVCAIVEYRHSGIAPFPAQVQDCKTAIRFMRKNADRFGIDPENIFLFGDSSGGHTVLLAATTQGNPELDTDAYAEFSDSVNAVAAFFPPTDIYAMTEYPSTMDHNAPDSPEGLEIGGVEVTANRDKAWWASPLAYLTGDPISPVLLAVGTLDELVPSNQSDRYAARLRELGKEYRYYSLLGASHGSWEFWTPTMCRLVDDFFKANERNERR